MRRDLGARDRGQLHRCGYCHNTAVENHPKPLFLRSLSRAEGLTQRYRTLHVAGRDAASFLQGQLTQDVTRVVARSAGPREEK